MIPCYKKNIEAIAVGLFQLTMTALLIQKHKNYKIYKILNNKIIKLKNIVFKDVKLYAS